jgi:hypothetical protein
MESIKPFILAELFEKPQVMKRNYLNYLKIIPIGLCFLLSMSAHAQDNASGSSLTFGLKAGAAISTFSHEQPHAGAKFGYTAGGFANYSFGTVSLQLEANYLQQGGTLFTYYDETRFGAESNFFTVNQKHSNVTLHNIEVPLLFSVALPAQGFTPRIYAGPSVAFTIYAEDNFEKTGKTYNDLIVTAYGKDNVTSTYEFFQVGAVGGLGVSIPMGDLKLLIDARYRYGITPARQSYSYISLNQTEQSIRTHTLSFTVGIGF